MSYNTELQANNTDLRAILASVNALPQAGSGESTPVEPKLQEKTVTPTTSQQDVTSDSGYDGLSKVIVEPIPSEYIVPNGELEIKQNGVHDVAKYASVAVNVPTEDLSELLTEQENMIAELQETLRDKASGGGEDTRFADLVMGTLSEVDDDSITSLKQYAFAYTDGLKTVRLASVTIMPNSVFRECAGLESVDLPNVTGTLGAYTFQNCSKLKTLNAPLATGSSTALCQNCAELERVEFGNMGTVGTSAFSGCLKLTTLIIRGGRSNGATHSNLSNVNAFTNTPIANGTGFIYVKKSLLSAFQSATNWSTYAAQIRAIEDYPEICGGGAQ